jgi:hypothetical protein
MYPPKNTTVGIPAQCLLMLRDVSKWAKFILITAHQNKLITVNTVIITNIMKFFQSISNILKRHETLVGAGFETKNDLHSA